GLMRGFQLWVNLPAADKMTAPRYQDIAPEKIPEVQPAPGINVRVVAGSFGGVAGPVNGVATQPVYLDIALEPHAKLGVPLPAGHNAFAYVFDGDGVGVGKEGDMLAHRELAVLGDGDQVDLQAGDVAARLLLVAGKPLNERVTRYGPFVMNTPTQIQEAFADYQAGRF
ncbi:MAG TPA: pirin-like C-terminal cupin domain-containing protein, partial [Rhodanobacteraceae bacterium]